MSNILEVDSAKLISRTAEKLKGMEVKRPEYLTYAKTGAGKERTPLDPDFYFIRCASVLRQTYLNGPIGIAKLRVRYGNRKRHVIHRHHHQQAGGSTIKDAFDALERLGYVKKTKAGRVITPKGRSFMDKAAGEVLKAGA